MTPAALLALAVACLAAPASAYVGPARAAQGQLPHARAAPLAGASPEAAETLAPEDEETTSAWTPLALGCAVGAVLGWVGAHRKQVAAAAVATAVAFGTTVSPVHAVAHEYAPNVEHEQKHVCGPGCGCGLNQLSVDNFMQMEASNAKEEQGHVCGPGCGCGAHQVAASKRASSRSLGLTASFSGVEVP